MSRRLDVGAAIETALNQATITDPRGGDDFERPTDFTADRLTHVVLTKASLPCAVVWDLGNAEQSEEAGPMVRNWDEFAIVLRAQGAETTPGDVTMDPFWMWAVRTVMADVTLGGASKMITMGQRQPVIPTVDAEKIYLELTQPLRVHYQVRRDDPAAYSANL